MIDLTTHKMILKLSGMKYSSGKTAAYWQDRTGADPRGLEPYITIRDDVCAWTPQAESVFQSHIDQVATNFQSIGCKIK
jgi:hypothetical protein